MPQRGAKSTPSEGPPPMAGGTHGESKNRSGGFRAVVLAGALWILNIAFQLTLTQTKGWLNNLPDKLLVILWVVPVVPLAWWAVTHEKIIRSRHWIGDHFRRRPIYAVAMALLVSVISVGSLSYAGYRLWILVFHHTTLKTQDPKYIPPAGPALRVDVQAPIASQLLCQNMSDEARLACLCPRPLPYTLEPLPAPKTNNYAARVTFTATREPIYRIRVFVRGPICEADFPEGFPYGAGKAAVGVGNLAYDKDSFLLNSTAPETTLKATVLSAEGLRIICANQEN